MKLNDALAVLAALGLAVALPVKGSVGDGTDIDVISNGDFCTENSCLPLCPRDVKICGESGCYPACQQLDTVSSKLARSTTIGKTDSDTATESDANGPVSTPAPIPPECVVACSADAMDSACATCEQIYGAAVENKQPERIPAALSSGHALLHPDDDDDERNATSGHPAAEDSKLAQGDSDSDSDSDSDAAAVKASDMPTEDGDWDCPPWCLLYKDSPLCWKCFGTGPPAEKAADDDDDGVFSSSSSAENTPRASLDLDGRGSQPEQAGQPGQLGEDVASAEEMVR